MAGTEKRPSSGKKGGKGKSPGKTGRKRRYPLILPYLLLCLVFCFAYGQRWLTTIAVDREIRSCEQALAALGEEKQSLESEIAALHDPETIELLARRNLCYIYPGETICLEAAVSKDLLPSKGSEEIIED